MKRLLLKYLKDKKYLTPIISSDCELACSVLGRRFTAEDNLKLYQQVYADETKVFPAVENELQEFNTQIIQKLNTQSPVLNEIIQYYFKNPGKQIRPTILLLLAKSLHGAEQQEFERARLSEGQKVFSQVVEMIHCSSLIHDDIIDSGETRRGLVAVHKKVGNKAAVYGGNYLISTASYICSELDDIRLLDLISTIIENLTKGELIQADATTEDINELVINYVHKTYFKTASLIAQGCYAMGLYHQCQDECFEFGKHIGLAFQYIDDIIDYTSDTSTLGKQQLKDVSEGLATGPVLFSSNNKSDILSAIHRKFRNPDDISFALDCAANGGLENTRHLALLHLQKATESLSAVPKDSHAGKILRGLMSLVYSRVS